MKIFIFKGADEKPGEDGSNVKNLKDKSEELMSRKELASKISKKKSELAPIIKELKALREAIDVKKNFCNSMFSNWSLNIKFKFEEHIR